MTDKLQELKRARIQLIKSSIWGIIAIIAAVCFVFYLTGNPINEYKLINRGKVVDGFITQAEEFVESGDEGGSIYSYSYAYRFKLPDGSIIKSGGNSSGKLPNQLEDLVNAYPIKIVYLPDRPDINAIRDSLSKNTWELLWRKIGLGSLLLVLFSSIGIITLKHGIRQYKSDLGNIRTINKT